MPNPARGWVGLGIGVNTANVVLFCLGRWISEPPLRAGTKQNSSLALVRRESVYQRHALCPKEQAGLSPMPWNKTNTKLTQPQGRRVLGISHSIPWLADFFPAQVLAQNWMSCRDDGGENTRPACSFELCAPLANCFCSQCFHRHTHQTQETWLPLRYK